MKKDANFEDLSRGTGTPDRRSIKPMQRVGLQDVRFYAYHGFYPEEQVIGNEFFVDVSVWFPYQEAETVDSSNMEEVSESKQEGGGLEDMQRTVNYEILYRVIKEEMEIPRKLLETACFDIFERLQLNFPYLTRIQVRIRKSNPPFGGDQAQALVEMCWPDISFD